MVQRKEKQKKINEVRHLLERGHDITPLLDWHFHVSVNLSLPIVIVIGCVLTIIPPVVRVIVGMEGGCRAPACHPAGTLTMSEQDYALRLGEAE